MLLHGRRRLLGCRWNCHRLSACPLPCGSIGLICLLAAIDVYFCLVYDNWYEWVQFTGGSCLRGDDVVLFCLILMVCVVACPMFSFIQGG